MTQDKMLERINEEIKRAVKHYKEVECRWDETHRINMARIKGMVEIYSMVTGKEYKITDHGILERRDSNE